MVTPAATAAGPLPAGAVESPVGEGAGSLAVGLVAVSLGVDVLAEGVLGVTEGNGGLDGDESQPATRATRVARQASCRGREVRRVSM
jgi:hypothetical protein